MRFSLLFAIALIVTGMGLSEANAAPFRHEEPRPNPEQLLPARAQFFGSEDYYQAQGGTPRDFVMALYRDVLGRPASQAEIDRWTSRLSQCGDGRTMAREFVIASQSELLMRVRFEPPCHEDRPCRDR